MLVAEANQKFESNSQHGVTRIKKTYEMLVAEANQKFESNSQLLSLIVAFNKDVGSRS